MTFFNLILINPGICNMKIDCSTTLHHVNQTRTFSGALWQLSENYLSANGKNYRVHQVGTHRMELEKCQSHQSWLGTVVKILTFIIIPLPLIASLIRYICRSRYEYEMSQKDKQDQDLENGEGLEPIINDIDVEEAPIKEQAPKNSLKKLSFVYFETGKPQSTWDSSALKRVQSQIQEIFSKTLTLDSKIRKEFNEIEFTDFETVNLQDERNTSYVLTIQVDDRIREVEQVKKAYYHLRQTHPHSKICLLAIAFKPKDHEDATVIKNTLGGIGIKHYVSTPYRIDSSKKDDHGNMLHFLPDTQNNPLFRDILNCFKNLYP